MLCVLWAMILPSKYILFVGWPIMVSAIFLCWTLVLRILISNFCLNLFSLVICERCFWQADWYAGRQEGIQVSVWVIIYICSYPLSLSLHILKFRQASSFLGYLFFSSHSCTFSDALLLVVLCCCYLTANITRLATSCSSLLHFNAILMEQTYFTSLHSQSWKYIFSKKPKWVLLRIR